MWVSIQSSSQEIGKRYFFSKHKAEEGGVQMVYRHVRFYSDCPWKKITELKRKEEKKGREKIKEEG